MTVNAGLARRATKYTIGGVLGGLLAHSRFWERDDFSLWVTVVMAALIWVGIYVALFLTDRRKSAPS